MAYTIQINEEQRLALQTVLENAFPGTCDSDAPLAYWIDMLKSLPNDEAETPGILHGFCL